MLVQPRYRILILGSFALSLLTLVLAVVNLHALQPEIPLWYTFTQPSQVLTNKWWILTIPLLTLFCSSSVLAVVLASRKVDDFIIRVYGWSTILNQTILLLALLRIILIT